MRLPWIEERNYPRGKRYYVFWYENKQKKGKSVGRVRAVAIEYKNKLTNSLIRNDLGIVDTSRTLGSLVDEYRQASQSKKPKTQSLIKYSLRHLEPLRVRPLVTLQLVDLEKLKQRMDQKYSQNGIKIAFSQIVACFNYAVKMGYIQANPCKGITLTSSPVAKFLTDDEIKRLLEACCFNEGLKTIVSVALHTGMREGEILSLTSDQIHDDMILIQKTKTDAPRYIPIHDNIRELLNGKGMIFEGWSVWRLQRAFGRATKRAGIKCRFHDLRHSFCSRYLRAGGSVADLRLISGHKSLAALQVYSHFQNSFLKQKIAAISFG